jgi:hypothetical protein
MSGSRVERGGSGAREALDAEAAPSGFWGWYGSADCRLLMRQVHQNAGMSYGQSSS